MCLQFQKVAYGQYQFDGALVEAVKKLSDVG